MYRSVDEILAFLFSNPGADHRVLLFVSFVDRKSSLPPPSSPLPPPLLPCNRLDACLPVSSTNTESTTNKSGLSKPSKMSTPLGTPMPLAPPTTSTLSKLSKVTHLIALVSTLVKDATRTPLDPMSTSPPCKPNVLSLTSKFYTTSLIGLMS